MRGVWSTLLLVVAAVGLGGYIYYVDSERPETEAKEKAFTVAADDIQELRITAKGETTVLKKTDATWKMVEPVAADVDENQVSSLVNSLTSLEITKVVEPEAKDLAEFGLATPKADVTYTAKGGATGRIRLGDQTPTAGDIYALRGDEKRVFLVGTFVETSLAHSAFELRDKRVLRFERDKADGLEIVTAAGTATLTRANSDWKLTSPVSARGDYGSIEGLLTKLSTTMMTEIAAANAPDLKAYGLDKPAATIAVKTGSSAATLAVSAPKDGKTYARDLSRPMVFVVDSTFATDAQKPASDYRKKELLDVRPFSASRVTLTRGAQVVLLEKVKGSGENAAEKWRVTVSGDGAAPIRDADDTAVSDLLDKLTALRAQTFPAPGATTGLATPALKIAVTFEETKKEEASVGRAGEKVFGARPDEGGAMEIEAGKFADALASLETVLKPPAPAPPPAAAPPGAAAATPEKKP